MEMFKEQGIRACGFFVVTGRFGEQVYLWVWLFRPSLLSVAAHDVKASNISSLGILGHAAATSCLLKHCLCS